MGDGHPAGAQTADVAVIAERCERAPDGRVDGPVGLPGDAEAVKREIGYASDDMRLYRGQTLRWHMDFVRSVYPGWDEAYAQDLLKRFDLKEQQKTGGFSHGQRVKALLLLCLARRPRLLLLDEPTTGLDPVARIEVLEALADVLRDESRSVLFSSHNTHDVEQMADTITFLHKGRLVASADKHAFLERWRRLQIDIPPGVVLPQLPDVVEVSPTGRLATLTTSHYRPELASALEQAGARIHETRRMSLEEIFVASVMGSRGKEQA